MRAAACSRLHECEALRDGRLGPTERSSFERHVGACSACAGELEALEALVAPLRESSPATDELHARRERARLLAAFEASKQVPVQRVAASRSRRWLAGAGVVLAACAGLVLWFARPVAPVSAVVHADTTAVWSTSMRGEREEIRLSRGSLLIHVDHHAAGQPRLRVALPDGELEDIGTIFTVSVQDGKTAKVAVQEGSVMLRLRNRPTIALGAGESWTPDSAGAQPTAAAGLPRTVKQPIAGAGPVEPVRPAGAQRTARTRSSGVQRSDIRRLATPKHVETSANALGSSADESAAGKPAARTTRPIDAVPTRDVAEPTTPTTMTAPPDPARDFRDATSALSRGQHRQAAAAFSAFVSRHPRDPRAEDAAYLRVLALQREGARDEVRAAARQYLQRYPDGLRHTEISRLLADGEAPDSQ